MSNFPVNPLGFPNPVINNKPSEIKPVQELNGPTFGEVLQDAIQQVSDIQMDAGTEVQKFMSGEVKDIHTAMVAVQKAEVSFQMMMQVRNKLVTAYQEIMRMPV